MIILEFYGMLWVKQFILLKNVYDLSPIQWSKCTIHITIRIIVLVISLWSYLVVFWNMNYRIHMILVAIVN